jgi:hypothetical protein
MVNGPAKSMPVTAKALSKRAQKLHSGAIVLKIQFFRTLSILNKQYPTQPHRKTPFFPSYSPSSPRSRATKERSHAVLPDKTAKENRSERAL